MKCNIDEVGCSKDFRVDHNPLRFEIRTQLGYCLLDLACNFTRIRAIRAVNRQNNGQLSANRRGSDSRRRSFRDASYITQSHVSAVVMYEYATCEQLGCARLSFRLQDNSLIGCLYKTSATYACGLTSCGNYFLDAHSVPNQPLRIELKLKLADFASIDFYSCDARNG